MSRKLKFINREISWLSFNARVLQEAEDPAVPLIQRLRFLGIFSNNRDEFFKVRVATQRRMAVLGKKAKHMFDIPPWKVLKEIQKIVKNQQDHFEKIYQNILRELEKKNIFFVDEKHLDQNQKEFVTRYFHENVRSAIVPIMIKNTPIFPYLKDQSLYLAVKLSNTVNKKKSQYALIEIPTDMLSRFVQLPGIGKNKYIILLDDIIRYCLKEIFSIFHYDCLEAYAVKFSRDAELDIDNDVSKGILEKLSKSIKNRERGEALRFVADASIPEDLSNYLMKKMNLTTSDNRILGGRYHNFKDFMAFPNIGQKKLEYKPAPPLTHKLLKSNQSILQVIKKKDILLNFPYQKFDHIIDLLREAAIDPKVISIKISLYRAAPKSKIINTLISAAKNGKKVLVVMELRARFDEKANINWSNILQEEGIQVIFGIPGIKIHCKLILITRREKGEKIYYANVGTGNYNEETAKVFSDTSLLTSDPRITEEVYKVFQYVENSYKSPSFKHLIVSPLYMRRKLVGLVNSEIKNAKAGKKAYITLKMNSLVDVDMIKLLYRASKNGVKIKLLVRGICSLVPGIKGVSDNIQAISIVDKFLEHSRIFVFYNNGDELYYISSADWMVRNLDHRVEVTCPVYDKSLQDELRDFLKIQWKDNVKARQHDELLKNRYRKTRAKRETRTQFALYNYFKEC